MNLGALSRITASSEVVACFIKVPWMFVLFLFSLCHCFDQVANEVDLELSVHIMRRKIFTGV